MGNVLSIILDVKDKATPALNAARGAINSYTSTMERFNGSVRSTYASVAQLAGSYVSLQTLWKGFSDGIKAVDDYRLATIGVAASLTDMAKKGSTNLEAVYRQNLKYAEETYSKVEQAAAKYFASGKEMIEAWQILTQKGVVVSSSKDLDNLGTLVDKIKLLTQGQASSMQIATELRAAMDGEVRAGAQLAMILRDQLGPTWDKQLATARAEGKVLEFLASVFKGLSYASGDVQETLEAQKSTLSTLVTQVGRAGLSGAYKDLSGYLSRINDYLKTHGSILAGEISTRWEKVKGYIDSIRDGIKAISSFSKENPFLAGLIADFAKLIALTAGFTYAWKFLWSPFKVAIGTMAALGTLLGNIFGPFTAWFSVIVIKALAVSGAFAAITAAAVSLGIAIAAWKLWDVIQGWEVAGLKIRDWVNIAETYLSDFWIYLKRMFTKDFPEMIGKAWDSALEKARSTLGSMTSSLKDFMSGDWMRGQMKDPNGTNKPVESEQSTEWSDETKLLMNRALRERYARLRDGRKAILEYEASIEAEGYSVESLLSETKPYALEPRQDFEKEREALKKKIELKKQELELEKAITRQKMEQASVKSTRGAGENLGAAKYWSEYFGIPENIFMALVSSESGWNRKALSGKGAMGLTQLMPGTARELGVVDPFDPNQSLRGGAQYLRQMYDRFNSWPMAITAYNAGPDAAARAGKPFGPLLDLVNQKLGGGSIDEYAKSLEREKTLLSEIRDMELSLAGTEEEKASIRLKYQSQFMDMETSLAKKREDSSEAARKAYEEAEKEAIKLAEERERAAREQLDTEVGLYSEMLQSERLTAEERLSINERYLEARKKQIAAEAEDLRKKGIEEVLVAEWVSSRLKEIEQKNLSYREALREGWKQTLDDFKTGAERMQELGSNLALGLRDGLKNIFLAPLRGGFDDLLSWFQSFVARLQDAWAEAMADMLVKWMTTQSQMSAAGTGGGIMGTIGAIVSGIFGGGASSSFDYGFTPGNISLDASAPAMGSSYTLAPSISPGVSYGDVSALLPSNAKAGGGGNSVNTTVNVTVNAPPGGSMDRRASEELGGTIGRVVEAQVTRVIEKHLSPGGMLSRPMTL